jgi:hypothetical protein
VTKLLQSRSDRAWLLLVLATLATSCLASQRGIERYAGAAALLIAYAKARMVVLDFMELRQAPFVWRAMTEAWLLTISLTFLAFVLQ